MPGGTGSPHTPPLLRAPTHASRDPNQVAGPPEKSELPLTEIAMAVAIVLGLAIAYTSLAPLLSGAPKSNAPVDTRAGARLAHRLRPHLSTALLDASPPHPPLTPTTSPRLAAADPSQWLPAVASPKKKKSPAAKRT